MQYAIETLVIEQKRLENILRKIEYEKYSEPIKGKLHSDLAEIKLAIKLIEPKFGFGRIQKLAEYVCQSLDISLQDLRTKCRKDKFLIPRYYVIYVAYHELNMSQEAIADYLGIERTTIFHSLKTAKNLTITDEQFMAWIRYFSIYAATLGKNDSGYPPAVDKSNLEE